MASRSEQDLSCPVCHDIYKNPVILSCNHSFCKDCLQNFWEERQNLDCPLCKRRSSKEMPPCYFALKIECESLLRKRALAGESEPLCTLHPEKLHFFCVDDQQLVCSVCRDSETHSGHRVTAAAEAAEENKKKLEDSLKPLRRKLRLIHEIKDSCDQTAEHIDIQTESTAERIREEFQRLHQFLVEEEEARMAALREEQEQKKGRMREKIGALNSEITALSETIRATEKELKAKDASFLQNYKAAVDRVQQKPLPDDPQLVSGALIDEARHLGNLSFRVWNNMKERVSYSSVILDPNSAHPDLLLSEDLTTVRQMKTERQFPNNPERIDHFFSVVGSEGFTSGCHSWDLEVGDNTAFVLGVCTESNPRKGIIWPGLWRLMFCNGEYKSLSPLDTGSDVAVMTNPKRIRVHLDWDGGKLTYSDADTDAHIHTFSHTFTEKLFPYISTWSDVPIKIVGVKFSVKVEQQSGDAGDGAGDGAAKATSH